MRDAGALEHDVRVGLRSGLERVRDFLRRELDTSGAHGVAVFCDSTEELFEALKLPVSVHQRVVINDAPFIEPLAGLDPGARFLIVLCNRRVGRLLFGSPEGLREVGRADGRRAGRHRQGGLSQPRYERSIDNEALAHIKRVGELVGRRFGQRALDGILLGGPEEARARLEEALPSAIRGRVVGSSTSTSSRPRPTPC